MTPAVWEPTGRPITDLTIEAMAAAYKYGRATKTLGWPWTRRRRAEYAAVLHHHALLALGRVQHEVGEADEEPPGPPQIDSRTGGDAGAACGAPSWVGPSRTRTGRPHPASPDVGRDTR